MLTKKAYTKTVDIFALNNPTPLDGIIKKQDLFIDAEFLKTASDKNATKSIDGDNTEFDIHAEIKNNPASLFVKCFAIKADETNDNGDHFSKSELQKAVHTFVGVPIFTNHQNTDINEARGKVVHSWWEEEKNGIMIIAMVDAEAYPQLANGIKKKYILGTSMGCAVKYSICSVCHNSAETPDQYCSCIKERKTRRIEAKNQKCNYHKHGNEDQCPLCSSTKDDAKIFSYAGQVFEHNYGIKFIENSFVVNPACHDCGITEIIDPQQFLSKLAKIRSRLPGLMKAASNTPMLCSNTSCAYMVDEDSISAIDQAIDFVTTGAELIIKESGTDYLKNSIKILMKTAGQKEITDLNNALNLITSVSQSMLSQKDQIDLEFLSDLVEVLSDLQQVTDELTEQGYGRLQSPTGEPTQQTNQPAAETSPDAPAKTNPPAAPAAGPNRVKSGPAGDVGTATGPLASKRIILKKIAHIKQRADKQIRCQNIIKKSNQTLFFKELCKK